jgi:hypothetical protein
MLKIRCVDPSLLPAIENFLHIQRRHFVVMGDTVGGDDAENGRI